jgi:2-oxoglutarate dehydrogenase E2 component (dihydrolipoamide succinyltransferase)
MAVDIVIPAVGESVTSGVVQRWVKKDGEQVELDEIIMELETDKVTAELRAPAAGTLQTLVKEGDTVAVGAVVGRVAEGSAKPAAAPAPAKAAVGAEPKPTTPPAKAAVATVAPIPAPAPEHADSDVRATPLARKLAAEHRVDISKISGSGPGQRVREQDVLDYVQSGRNGTATPPAAPSRAPAPAAAPAPRPTLGSRGLSRERMSPLRQRIAARLVQAQHTAAMLTTFNEVDMSAVMELRKQYKEEFEKKHGIGLGFMSFFVKAAVGALRTFPKVNGFIVEDEGVPAIESHDYCDVAVAVSTPKGLVVPVLRSAESLSMAAIEQGIKDLASRAKEGKLALEDMQGGTFTITNGGVFGDPRHARHQTPPRRAPRRQRPSRHPSDDVPRAQL